MYRNIYPYTHAAPTLDPSILRNYQYTTGNSLKFWHSPLLKIIKSIFYLHDFPMNIPKLIHSTEFRSSTIRCRISRDIFSTMFVWEYFWHLRNVFIAINQLYALSSSTEKNTNFQFSVGSHRKKNMSCFTYLTLGSFLKIFLGMKQSLNLLCLLDIT